MLQLHNQRPHQHTSCNRTLHPQVLREAAPSIGMYTDVLLSEVARVAARPAYNSPQAGRARQAAMELLRDYGPQGQAAFRNVVSGGPLGARPPGMVGQGPPYPGAPVPGMGQMMAPGGPQAAVGPDGAPLQQPVARDPGETYGL